jgi:hypothetical protein
MSQQSDSDDGLVVSYLILRRAIGIIGIALPFVLVIGKILLDGPGLEDTISHYYYTDMRDVFVGSLCSIAVFLMSYRGYEHADRIAGNLACAFALGVALLPTSPDQASPRATLIGYLHLFSAACLLLTLAYFSLVLFRKTDPTKTPTPRKLQRNSVYMVCGWTIVVCVALAAIVGGFVSKDSPAMKLDPIFWLESVAVIAFGIAWLTKGEALLPDVPDASRGPNNQV